MKTSLMAALLLSASSGVVFAQDVSAVSHVDSVTVYPQGADVTRVAKIDLGVGDDVVSFADLPANVDPQSIRVEGSGQDSFEIGSVDTKLQSDVIERSSERKEFEAQIEKLTDERVGLGQSIADLETERKLLLSLADKVRVQTVSTTVANGVDVAGFDTMMTNVGTRLAATTKTIQDAKIRQRQIDKDVAVLQEKIQNFAPEGRQHLLALVHLKAATAEVADLKLTYRVQDASWHAFYDARLSLPKAEAAAQISLVRRADVEQATGEDWSDVHLVLSTAQPAESAAAPQLDEQQIRVAWANGNLAMDAAAPALAKRDEAKDKTLQEGEVDMPPAATPAKPASEQQARIVQAGFDANYVVEGKVSIDKNGTSKKINIGTDNYQAKLIVETVPRLDTNAYLSASFTTNADAPLLAGPVNLFRDGSFVGQTQMAEFASGEDAKLGFGVDDLVKVKRAEVKRLAAQEGLITTSDTQEMAWTISVSNLHNMKMPIRVLDRKPYSSDSKILVSDIAGLTLPSATDLEHKRGILAWDLNLEAKSKAEIHTGYKVTSPKDLHVQLVD